MPTCQSCFEKWSWKETFKKSFTLDIGMKCPYCNKMQYYSSRFRKRSSLIPFIIITLIMLGNFIFGPSYIFFLTLIGLFPLFMGVYPFFVELTNEEEPLWRK